MIGGPVQPSHSAYDDPEPERVVEGAAGRFRVRTIGLRKIVEPIPADIEDLSDAPLLTAQPRQEEIRWNADGRMVRAGQVPSEEKTIGDWLDEEFGAVQRALAGEDE